MSRHARSAAVAAWTLAIILAALTTSSAQESLSDARQLYAAADYKGALTMLNTLLAASPSPQERQSIELYRTFCLVALGNTDEANKAIEAMVSRSTLPEPPTSTMAGRRWTFLSFLPGAVLPAGRATVAPRLKPAAGIITGSSP